MAADLERSPATDSPENRSQQTTESWPDLQQGEHVWIFSTTIHCSYLKDIVELSHFYAPSCQITREYKVQQNGTLSVLYVAHGRKVKVQDQEAEAAKEAAHTQRESIVTGISVVIKDAEQTLTPNVDVAFVDNAAEHHYGEDL